MKTGLYSLFFSLLLFANCSKSNNSNVLPAATQSGQNIVAFTINGAVHIYTGKTIFNNPAGVDFEYIPSLPCLAIEAINKAKYNDDLGVSIAFVLPVIGMNYKISNSGCGGSYSSYDNYTDISYPQYIIDTINSTLTFTRFDGLVAAGTFNLITLKDSVHTNTYTIQGFFDISR
jgi:hypothetical protein